MNDLRNVMITIRLTDRERVTLYNKVERAGYNSVSRYLRERVIQGRRILRNDIDVTEGDVMEKLEELSSDMSAFRKGHEDAVRQLKKMKDGAHDGMGEKTVAASLQRVENLYSGMLERMSEMEDLLSRLGDNRGTQEAAPSMITNNPIKMLQRIEIIGNLTGDAELKDGKDGRPFIVFRVGVHENVGEEKRSTYYDVTYPNGGVFNYLKKGRQVYVAGKLSLSTYMWEGRAEVNARISARELELCGSREV